MNTNISNIKPEYNNKNEDLFNNKSKGGFDLKKEVDSLTAIIDKSRKLNESFKRDKFANYAY